MCKMYDVVKTVRKANGEYKETRYPGCDEWCVKQFIKGYIFLEDFMGTKLYVSKGRRVSYEIAEIK